MFHPNFEPQICHDLTLQIISYQIKDNMWKHGSMGLFRKLNFGGKFGLLGVLAFPLSVYFSFLFGSAWNKHGGDYFRHPSGFKQIFVCPFFLFLFDNSAHCSDSVWSKESFHIFLYFFFYFSFAFLQSLIVWFSFSLFFPFLLWRFFCSFFQG